MEPIPPSAPVPSPPAPDRLDGQALQRRVNELQQQLEAAFAELLARRRAAAGLNGAPAPSTVRLHLDLVQPGASGHAADQMYTQVQRQVDRCVDRFARVRLGTAYCHWCARFDCEHASPPEPRAVFSGYSPTGQPLWRDLASILLEKRHPRVDVLYRSTPSPVALVQGGDELSQAQLSVYGKRSPIYRILGQVSLGYLLYPGGLGIAHSRVEGRWPIALTFQIVESGADGAPLVLNVIGKLPDETPAYQALEESSDARLADAILATRRGLEELSLLGGGRRRRAHERRRMAFSLLHRLARNLERIFRQRDRRTQHSRDRHLDRQRPASTALGDALHATAESIFRDVEEQTWVIVGPKNRVHVFNDVALHVTSIVYPGETVRHRTTRGKWRAPGPEEMAEFQEALRRRASGE
jgi:hypothetical protein